MVTKRDQIIQKVIDLLKENPQGIRYSEIVRRVKELLPDIPVNTIHGTVWDLDVQKSNEVFKADRGLFRHVSFRGKDEIVKVPPQEEKKAGIKELDFYQSFAEYLVGELGDCTKGICLAPL